MGVTNDTPAMSAEAELCAACRHVAVVVSDRGTTFYRCERAKTDPRYAKYPRIPVLACPGFESACSELPRRRAAREDRG